MEPVLLPEWIKRPDLARLQERGLVELLMDLEHYKPPSWDDLVESALSGSFSTDGKRRLTEEECSPEMRFHLKNGTYDHDYVLSRGETYESRLKEDIASLVSSILSPVRRQRIIVRHVRKVYLPLPYCALY